jgi:2-methylcitrate dehydratase PrpD
MTSASLRFEDIDAATIELVRSFVIDTLGCGIAAFDEKAVRICRDVALASGEGTSTVIATSRRIAPDLAAFANGAAFRYYDLATRPSSRSTSWRPPSERATWTSCGHHAGPIDSGDRSARVVSNRPIAPYPF